MGRGQTPGLSSRALFGVVSLAPHKLPERSQQKASAGSRSTPWGTIAAKPFSPAKAAVCACEAEPPGAGTGRRRTAATQAPAVCAGCEKPLEVWCRAEPADSPAGFSASLVPGTAAGTVPKQRWASLCQQGHPAHPNISTRSGTASPRCLQPGVRGALRGLRPSHLTQAPATFIPGQDAGSQRVLSSQPEQKAQRGAGSTESHRAHGPRGARGRAPCRAPVAGAGGLAGAGLELHRRWRNTFEPHWAMGRGSPLPQVHPELPRTQNWMEQGKLG